MTQWMEADMPDLAGKTAVVTGANSGLGGPRDRLQRAHGDDTTLRRS